MFKWNNLGDFKCLKITEFEKEGAKAFFTTKNKGVSKGKYKSLNLGLHTEDKSINVIKNRKIVAKKLNLNFSSFTTAEQIHGNNVYIVKESDRGKGSLNYNNSIKNTDALITNSSNIVLFSYYADCVPLYFFDPKNKVIALAHAGWKGTLNKIALNVLKKMRLNFSTDIAKCIVAIGPAISKNHYEVDKNLINKFDKEFKNISQFFVHKFKDKYLLDLKSLNENILLNNGIYKENLIKSKLCTYENEENFYSYRRDNGKTGRMASIISL
ncbi:MAG: peptidoglycan editing factor PgeF [Bacillota bacterium]